MKDETIEYKTENGFFYIINGTIKVDHETVKDTAALFKDIKKALNDYHKSHELLEKREFNIKNILGE